MVTRRAILEQDYYLSFSPEGFKVASIEHREEFFRYDSQGGLPPIYNPIYVGKRWEGITATMLISDYFNLYQPYWPGSNSIIDEYSRRKYGILAIRKWFGSKVVSRWIINYMDYDVVQGIPIW